MIYFTSDTHLGHSNIIMPDYADRQQFQIPGVMYENRRNVYDMSPDIKLHGNMLIDNINKVVDKSDQLYHLGDFAFGSIEKVKGYRDRINCENIILIVGNHDIRRTLEQLWKRYNGIFSMIVEELKVKVGGRQFHLSHNPMSRVGLNLHGHIHTIGQPYFNKNGLLDVGVDNFEYCPVSEDKIMSLCDEYDNK